MYSILGNGATGKIAESNFLYSTCGEPTVFLPCARRFCYIRGMNNSIIINPTWIDRVSKTAFSVHSGRKLSQGEIKAAIGDSSALRTVVPRQDYGQSYDFVIIQLGENWQAFDEQTLQGPIAG